MSLVSTYVRINGLWYQDPVIYKDNWYLCFDDDDPPEIVVHPLVKQLSKVERRLLIRYSLNQVDAHAKIISHSECGQRCFPPEYKEFKRAVQGFVQLTSIWRLSGLNLKYVKEFGIDQPKGQGVYYKL